MQETQRILVMLVDDNADLLKAYRWILESEGYEVITAVSGDDALAILAKGAAPAGIFIDYSMPMMSGAELVEKIRERSPGVNSPRLVIFTSFSPNAPQLDDVRLAGVDIAEKPNDIHSLNPLIQKFLKKAS